MLNDSTRYKTNGKEILILYKFDIFLFTLIKGEYKYSFK